MINVNTYSSDSCKRIYQSKKSEALFIPERNLQLTRDYNILSIMSARKLFTTSKKVSLKTSIKTINLRMKALEGAILKNEEAIKNNDLIRQREEVLR